MARNVTPGDLTITPRDRRFGRGQEAQRWWMGGDPVATAFYNALSATFPKGEAFFVEACERFARARIRSWRRKSRPSPPRR
jgi:predicted metal-dependent hydrolase